MPLTPSFSGQDIVSEWVKMVVKGGVYALH